MSSSFVHLHLHTQYSLLDGVVRTPKLLDECKKNNMNAVAITDNGAMYGVIEFYVKAKEMGIKPIVGCDMYLTADITQKERGLDRLILLCKSKKGYQNLIKLVTISHLDGFYYRPRIDYAHLQKHSEDLIAISPGLKGPVGYQLQRNNIAAATQHAETLKQIYGDNFYLGIQRAQLPFENMLIDGSKQLSETLNIPLVAINDVYYLKEEEAFVRNVLTCIQSGKTLEEDTRAQFQSQELYFKTAEEMNQLFADMPEAIANTVKIADQCNVEIETEQVHLPEFKCPDNLAAEDYLKQRVIQGIEKKYGEMTPHLQKRADYELSVINKMHYAPYFLIIDDFLEFCRRNDIPVGPGRGSAAGSIVAYALDITKIDPIQYNLLFERFLNPERISMPDVDIDFCIKRRSEVIDYIVKRWGTDHVSQIITFGTMAARGVVRDVGRVLGIPLIEVDRIAKLIPSTPGQYTSIPEALETVPDLKKLYDQNAQHKKLLDLGAKIEGQTRHTSTHAAGVVISKEPLSDVVPLVKNEGQAATQFAMSDIEKVGLLKMDILGLRNLTVMKEATRLIKERHQVELDLDALTFDDKKTYDLLCTGETAGVFQLESRGMRQLIKDLQPRVFEDIIALLALYRPGPLGSGMVSEFISNKSGKTQVKYELTALEPILKDTYGMIVYQEQVMQIASVIGGFTLGQADMLRRAMGKKKKDVMDKMRSEFLEGAIANDYPKDKAEKIFDLCYKFAEYGFNKSHSAAYAMVSYQTAYLKANYPVEYMTALLSSVLGSADKASLYIQECSKMNIVVLPPDVNQSMYGFSIEEIEDSAKNKSTKKPAIRFGLGAIKNIGEGAIENIIANRQKEPYKTLIDMALKVDLRQVNKRVVESLIKSGALDSIQDRGELLFRYEKILDSAQTTAKELSQGQTSLFGQNTLEEGIKSVQDSSEQTLQKLTKLEALKMEKEMLGLYITGHPLNEYKDKLKNLKHSINTLTIEDNDRPVVIGGILSECRKVITKTKREMLIGKLEDQSGEIVLMVFENDHFEAIKNIFVEDAIIIVNGKVRVNQEEITVVADKIELIDDSQLNKKLMIDTDSIDDLAIYEQLKKISKKHNGSMPLYFRVGDVTILAHRNFWLTQDPVCIREVEDLIGSGHVWVS